MTGVNSDIGEGLDGGGVGGYEVTWLFTTALCEHYRSIQHPLLQTHT